MTDDHKDPCPPQATEAELKAREYLKDKEAAKPGNETAKPPQPADVQDEKAKADDKTRAAAGPTPDKPDKPESAKLSQESVAHLMGTAPPHRYEVGDGSAATAKPAAAAKTPEDTKPKPDHPAEDKPKDWELPDGTTRATLPDGSAVYTLPDGTQRHDHAGQPTRYILKSPPGAGADPTSAKDIAEQIRGKVDVNYSQKVHPDDQHLQAMALAVSKELDMDPNPLNLNHISGLINQYVKAPSREFPKMKYNHVSKTEIVVDDAKAEADLGPGWGDTHWSAAKREVTRPRHPQVTAPSRVEPSPGDA